MTKIAANGKPTSPNSMSGWYRLAAWWGGTMLSESKEVRAATIPRVEKDRRRSPRPAGFRAAISHHAKEGFHRGVVRVALPDKGPPRDRWLTRRSGDALVGVLANREGQPAHRGGKRPEDRDRQKAATASRALHSDWPLYRHPRGGDRGSIAPPRDGRPSSILRPASFIACRKARPTNKRQPPVALAAASPGPSTALA